LPQFPRRARIGMVGKTMDIRREDLYTSSPPPPQQ
jgi:hypothetical protein